MRIIIIIIQMKAFSFILIVFVLMQSNAHAKKEIVNIYSARQEVLMREIIGAFEKKDFN